MSNPHHSKHASTADERVDELESRGLELREAIEWVHRVGTNVDDLMEWKQAGFSPVQAEELSALADESVFHPDAWRDSEFPPEQVLKLVRAGVGLDAARVGDFTPAGLNTLAGLRKADNNDKIRAFRKRWHGQVER